MNFIELFAGVGGLSEGFVERSFKPIAYIEKDGYCCDTLRTRQVYFALKKKGKLDLYRQYLREEISRDELYKHAPSDVLGAVMNEEISESSTPELVNRIKERLKGNKLDLVLGGPPCQVYSLIGRAQNKGGENDVRWHLYKHYMKFLKELKPTAFIFENVPGLLSMDKGKLWETIINEFKLLGYTVDAQKLNAKDYGVLQNRERMIITGCLNKKIDLNKLEKVDDNKHTVRDILKDLCRLNPGETKNKYKLAPSAYLVSNKIRQEDDILTLHQSRPHNTNDLEIYKLAINLWNEKGERLRYSSLPSNLKNHKNEKSFLDRFKVVGKNLDASHTVVAHIAKDGHYYIHPDIKQCRSISVREAARIQSFPDNFLFEGPRTAQFTQIGNAVSPLLSLALAKLFKPILSS